MRTAWNIFKLNVNELVKKPASLAATLALLVLASLFAWYAVGSLWNPYANIGKLKVALVNEDAGASLAEVQTKAASSGFNADALKSGLGVSSDDEKLNVGTYLADSLTDGAGFDWQLVDADQARRGLATGEYYAEFVFPEEFTTQFLKALSGEVAQPVVEYWVNETCNSLPVLQDNEESGSNEGSGVSSDSSANENANAGTVEAAVSKKFSSLTRDALSETLEKAAGKLSSQGQASSALDAGLDGAAQDLKTVETSLNRARESIEQWRTVEEDAKKSLDSLKEEAPDLRDSLASGQEQLAEAREAAHKVASAYGSAFAQGGEALSGLLSDVGNRVDSATAPLVEAQQKIDAELADAEKALSQCEKLVAALEKADPGSSTVADLKEQNEKLKGEIANLKKNSKTISEAVENARSVSSGLSKEAQEAIESLENRTDTFNEVLLPQLDTSLDTLAIVMGTLNGALGSLDAQIAQTKTLLEGLENVMQKIETALDELSEQLAESDTDLATARSDVAALANAKSVQDALNSPAASFQSPDTFMTAPVNVEVEQLYAPVSYGAGMAPLFANLALWAGCLLLVLTVRTNVDPKRFFRMRVWQGYLGCLLPIAILALLQGIIIIVGYIVMGIQAVSPFAMVLAGAIAALCVASIVFALDAVFAHAGKVLAVLLFVVQIPAALGAYPVQLSPEQFQMIESWMPLTHGVRALDAAIGGFYGFVYMQELLWLIACAVVTFALGVFAQPRVSSLVRLVNRRLQRTGLFANVEEGGFANSMSEFAAERAAALEAPWEDDFFESERQQALVLMRARKLAARYSIMKSVAPLASLALVATLVVVSLALPLSSEDKLVALEVFAVAVAVVFVLSLAFERAFDKIAEQLAEAGVDVSEVQGVHADAPVRSAPVITVPEIDDVLLQPLQGEWETNSWNADFVPEWEDEDSEAGEAVADVEDAKSFEGIANDEDFGGLEDAEDSGSVKDDECMEYIEDADGPFDEEPSSGMENAADEEPLDAQQQLSELTADEEGSDA